MSIITKYYKPNEYCLGAIEGNVVVHTRQQIGTIVDPETDRPSPCIRAHILCARCYQELTRNTPLPQASTDILLVPGTELYENIKNTIRNTEEKNFEPELHLETVPTNSYERGRQHFEKAFPEGSAERNRYDGIRLG